MFERPGVIVNQKGKGAWLVRFPEGREAVYNQTFIKTTPNIQDSSNVFEEDFLLSDIGQPHSVSNSSSPSRLPVVETHTNTPVVHEKRYNLRTRINRPTYR